MGKVGQLILKNVHWLIVLNFVWNSFNAKDALDLKLAEMENEKASLITQKDKLLEELKLNKVFSENLEQIKKRILEIREEITVAQKQLPTDNSDTLVLDSFNAEATALNIKEVYLSPGKETNQGFYFAKDYQFKGVATWLQGIMFFEQLFKRERIYNVKELSLKKSARQQKGKYQLIDLESVIESFRYNPQHKEEDTSLQKKDT